MFGHGDQHRNVRRDRLLDEIDEAAPLCFELAETVEDDDIGAVSDRGRNRARDVGDPAGVELTLVSAAGPIVTKTDGLLTRQHDGVEAVIVASVRAELHDPRGARARAAKVRGKTEQQPVRIVVNPIGDRRKIALRVEHHIPSKLNRRFRYIQQDIS